MVLLGLNECVVLGFSLFQKKKNEEYARAHLIKLIFVIKFVEIIPIFSVSRVACDQNTFKNFI